MPKARCSKPLGVGIHAIDLGHLRPGMSVGVFGCGPIGLLIMQLARMSGATHIIATDPAAASAGSRQVVRGDNVFQAEGGQEAAEILAATARPRAWTWPSKWPAKTRP